ncbi:MAG: hypothetical protein LBS88_00750, partial [Tannerellaceae bacterium]|nr:hypothetical protein [Tannerellaceae bacterium]
MKRIGIFCFSLLIFASCSANQEQTPVGPDIRGDFIDLGLIVALVDQDLQDRLNPESPAYFGDEYAQGIEILYPYKDRKIRYPDLVRYVTNENVEIKNYTAIRPPFREIPGYDGAVGQNLLGYYFLATSLFWAVPSEDGLIHIYIQYPDGSEDEVKVQVYENEEGTVVLIDEIRYNDELVYDMRL